MFVGGSSQGTGTHCSETVQGGQGLHMSHRGSVTQPTVSKH